jgi:hypothetical protein
MRQISLSQGTHLLDKHARQWKLPLTNGKLATQQEVLQR